MKTVNNNVTLIGRLGKDPEFKALENGSKVVNFSLATSQTYTKKDSGDKVEKTQWHNIVMWNGLAEVVSKYVKKGHQLAVSGQITYRQYEDKDGKTRYVTEIICDEMEMLTPKGYQPESSPSPATSDTHTSESPAPAGQQSSDASTANNEIDDLPF